jgi:cyclopropane fatty-acyl-phospholipid synthase-like methyltransferase
MTQNNNWFETWFDSPYYHLLYNHRNEIEAESFIRILFETLNIRKGQKIWDHACGKGRHALALEKIGMRVVGTDLSENSIKQAKKHESENLKFEIHDMRNMYKTNVFDVVVNLFTSFGYFTNENDYEKVFKSVYKSLKPNGLFIIDFLNAEKVKFNIVPTKIEKRGDIDFNLEKAIDNGFVINKISFEDKGQSFSFEEKVRLFSKSDFHQLAINNNFEEIECFGNYNLDTFNEKTADRLVLILRKK